MDIADTTTYRHAQLTHLKRKLEDLEEVHREGKRQHAVELERVKTDHECSKRANKEQAEQIQRLKKHNELTEGRIQDIKKAVSDAQAETRELRIKLRCIEAERDRLASKQSNAAETRKALSTAEARKKDGIQEREKRISELQAALSVEKERVLEVEAKAREQRTKVEREAREARVKNTIIEQRLERVQKELKEAESRRSALERESSSTSESLATRVSDLEKTLRLTAEEYGRLSSSTTSSASYDELKLEAERLRLHIARLERKLGNSEEQVYELAQLIRQTQDTNSFLSQQLRETQSELEWRNEESKLVPPQSLDASADDELRAEVDEFLLEEGQDREEEQATLLDVMRTQLKLSRENSKTLLDHLSSTERLLANECTEATRLKSKLSDNDIVITKLSQESEARGKECEELRSKITSHTSEIFNLQTKVAETEKKLIEAESRARTELARREEMLRKERELTSRLQSAVHKSKMAEDALNDEIAQLTAELAGADAYREAYQSIAEEMRGLVARNALAEDEANRLSQFNAEILSHRNPTQKILYVDRIRRELAETKQKLALSTRDNESATSEIATLREELAMYKSVTVPFSGKPKTTMTRVRRIPFSTAKTVNIPASVPPPRHLEEEEEEDAYSYSNDENASSGYRLGEMTMDELA